MALLQPGGAAVLSVPLPITQHDAAMGADAALGAHDLGLSGRADLGGGSGGHPVVLAPAGWKVRVQPCSLAACLARVRVDGEMGLAPSWRRGTSPAWTRSAVVQ